MTSSRNTRKKSQNRKGSASSALSERPSDQNEERPNSSSAASRMTRASESNEDHREFIDKLTGCGRWSSLLPAPKDLPRLRAELRNDLREVPAALESGEVTDVYEKIDSDDFLSKNDKELIWNCLAIVRDMFWRLEHQPDNEVPGYQWEMNWKHTRAEIDQVYDAALVLELSTKETRDAIIASLFSDSVKSRKNFIIHNIHGAEASAQVLSYFLDLNKQTDRRSMERVSRACMEHQIAPPAFMATVAAIMIHHKNNLGRFNRDATTFDDPRAQAAHSVFGKISDPFNRSHLTKDLRRIVFTDEEKEVLSSIGIEDWHVPHPDDPSSRIGHAVIAGDHSINYNNPEGFAKIALLRGPDTESIFEDPTIYHSLESAVDSFIDSFRVISPEVQSLTLNGLRRTKRSVARVTAVMTEIFNGIVVGPRNHNTKFSGAETLERAIARAHDKHPELYEADSNSLCESGTARVERALEHVAEIMDDWYREHGALPFNPKGEGSDQPGPGSLPFWNAPLKYPARDENGKLKLESLTELEQIQYKFADRIREIAVELLRAEQWIYTVCED